MERNRAAAVTTCIWFVACLCLPLLQNAFHFVPDLHITENRTLAKFPPPGLRASYGRELQDYIADHFGLRLHLSTAANYLSVLLGESSSPNVVIGKHGWLYYAENLTGNSGDLATLLPTATERLEACQRWLADRGIVDFIVVPIDKHNIYPEHVPDHAVRVETSILYQPFRAYLREHHSPLNVVDIEDATRAEKSRGEILYCKSDTHWNNLGALVGASQMLAGFARVFPAVPVHGVADYDRKPIEIAGGDLSQMLALPMFYSDINFDLTPHFTPRAKAVDPGFTMPENEPWAQPLATEISDERLPRAVVLRDSYMGRAFTPVSEGFRRAVFVWNRRKFMSELVEREHPDMVVQEALERDFAHIEPLPANVLADLAALKRRQQAFAATPAVVDRASLTLLPSVFRPRAPIDEERRKLPMLEISGAAQVPTVLSIDTGDGPPQKRVLYPGDDKALVTLAKWPTEVRVEQRAGAMKAGRAVELTLKAIDAAALAAGKL